MIEILQKTCQDFNIRQLNESDSQDIFALYQSNPDYFEIVEGRAPTLEDCFHDLTECPPNFDNEKKFYVGFYKDKNLVAVMDYLAGYPSDDIFYIGLFMIDGQNRARGVGRRLLAAVLEAARLSGFQKLRLGVIAENINALNFWTKNGLSEIRRATRERDNGTVADVIVMEKELV